MPLNQSLLPLKLLLPTERASRLEPAALVALCCPQEHGGDVGCAAPRGEPCGRARVQPPVLLTNCGEPVHARILGGWARLPGSAIVADCAGCSLMPAVLVAGRSPIGCSLRATGWGNASGHHTWLLLVSVEAL